MKNKKSKERETWFSDFIPGEPAQVVVASFDHVSVYNCKTEELLHRHRFTSGVETIVYHVVKSSGELFISEGVSLVLLDLNTGDRKVVGKSRNQSRWELVYKQRADSMERREKNGCKRQTLNRMKNLLKITAVVITVFLANTAGAQKILVGAGGGYATFSMSDTKDYNKWVLNNLPFTPVLTDDFPDWYFLNGEVLWSFPKFLAAGVKLSNTSTGSRLHLADYSGEYTFDNTQTGWFPGVKLLLGKAPGHNSGLCASVEGGLAFSSMFLREELVVGDEVVKDKATLNALGFYVQPGLFTFSTWVKTSSFRLPFPIIWVLKTVIMPKEIRT